ncbi:MAG TPA: ATP-binding protein [Anaerohalosphaeraceae bacterium]|nr:ATP-binding protein [Anaerohalosphaeraceae bacterium]
MTVKPGSSSEHLWWVVSLLAAAVILPTVCLLWFMTAAVRNERLAMRQKLSEIYQKRLETAAQDHLGFDNIKPQLTMPGSDGLVVYESNGIVIFPGVDPGIPLADQQHFAEVAPLEHGGSELEKAQAQYQNIAESADDPAVKVLAMVSHARCLHKLGRTDDALAMLDKVLTESDEDNLALRAQKCRAYLFLLECLKDRDRQVFCSRLSQAFEYAMQGTRTSDDFAVLGKAVQAGKVAPADIQLYALNRLMDYGASITGNPELENQKKHAAWLQARLNISLTVAQYYPAPSFVTEPGIIQSAVLCLDADQPVCGVYSGQTGHEGKFLTLMVFNPQSVSKWFAPYLSEVKTFPAECSIYDAKGTLVTGASMPSGRKPFLILPLGSEYFPDWTVALYIDGSAFENAASKQVAVYIWVGLLVVMLFLVCGALTAQMIGRQIRLNRLKNNFIATVTHELKTPLSSMRLLVDTLLDGSYANQQQCKEYLELIGRENERLSRMIDSFLTFSRMERNKQVFEFKSVHPDDIVKAAAETVHPKMAQPGCDLSVSIAENLPHVWADKDAMVTVLVNLLDNAWKYSLDHKTIRLSAYAENGRICFAVADNGLGIPRRLHKKIFGRFYQVDNRLSRRVEGCGLGLSIVKYIVNAHKGVIEVKSKIAEGSTFTVKLNACSQDNTNHNR